MTNRLVEYVAYHEEMARRGDLDPQYPALVYVADRFELNREQRYWLAFLFATCYSVPTTFYMYNEFPDYENVDLGRMQRWWDANRDKVVFQTDRRWIRSRNAFVAVVDSYQKAIGKGVSQTARFWTFQAVTPEQTYGGAFAYMSRLYQFGRYAMFLYLEAVHQLTRFEMEPTDLDVKNALSSRNGLCYAIGRDDLIDQPLNAATVANLERTFQRLVVAMKGRGWARRPTTWNVETSLCAFKKLQRGKRWLNFYIDRQADEIESMQQKVRSGVDWSVLWDHRREHFDRENLREFTPSLERRMAHCGVCGSWRNG